MYHPSTRLRSANSNTPLRKLAPRIAYAVKGLYAHYIEHRVSHCLSVSRRHSRPVQPRREQPAIETRHATVPHPECRESAPTRAQQAAAGNLVSPCLDPIRTAPLDPIRNAPHNVGTLHQPSPRRDLERHLPVRAPPHHDAAKRANSRQRLAAFVFELFLCKKETLMQADVIIASRSRTEMRVRASGCNNEVFLQDMRGKLL